MCSCSCSPRLVMTGGSFHAICKGLAPTPKQFRRTPPPSASSSLGARGRDSRTTRSASITHVCICDCARKASKAALPQNRTRSHHHNSCLVLATPRRPHHGGPNRLHIQVRGHHLPGHLNGTYCRFGSARHLRLRIASFTLSPPSTDCPA